MDVGINQKTHRSGFFKGAMSKFISYHHIGYRTLKCICSPSYWNLYNLYCHLIYSLTTSVELQDRKRAGGEGSGVRWCENQTAVTHTEHRDLRQPSYDLPGCLFVRTVWEDTFAHQWPFWTVSYVCVCGKCVDSPRDEPFGATGWEIYFTSDRTAVLRRSVMVDVLTEPRLNAEEVGAVCKSTNCYGTLWCLITVVS